jgi:hypothetical protein
MKRSVYFNVLLMALLLLSFSCKKGNIVGPTGVYYSDWITPGPYTQSTLVGVISYDANIPVSRITHDVLNNGVVLIYAKLDGYDPTIWPPAQVSLMPVSIFYQQDLGNNRIVQFTDLWSARITTGNIDIHVEHNDYTLPSLSPGYEFRYVIVPANEHIMETVNAKNYNELKTALHIQD